MDHIKFHYKPINLYRQEGAMPYRHTMPLSEYHFWVTSYCIAYKRTFDVPRTQAQVSDIPMLYKLSFQILMPSNFIITTL